MDEARALLDVKGLQAWYGESHILHGVDFSVREGEVVTLLGRNGAGKTTTLKSVMGMIGKRTGSVLYEGRETIGLTSDRIAHLGLAICPEERGIFASLNVLENLMLPPQVRPGGLPVEQIFELFPNLKERITSLLAALYACQTLSMDSLKLRAYLDSERKTAYQIERTRIFVEMVERYQHKKCVFGSGRTQG